MKTTFRTVPDTNVVIALQNASETSPNREYFERWNEGEFALLYSEDTLREYIKKLLEKNVPREIIRKLVISIIVHGKQVSIEFFHFPIYPIDPDDIAFLLCAENGNATHLISYDKHLKVLNDYYSFKVCETLEFLFELRSELEKLNSSSES